MTAKKRTAKKATLTNGSARWDKRSFRSFVQDGRAAERAKKTPTRDRLFVNRKIASAAQVSEVNLSHWWSEKETFVDRQPTIDQYERLREYFGVSYGTWLK